MTPHRGLIGARKKRQDWYGILRSCRDYMEVGTFNEIMPTLKVIIKERDEEEKRLNALLAEFNKKKIGVMKIRRIGKVCNTTKKGVLYFDKRHIGKRVMVWEKA